MLRGTSQVNSAVTSVIKAGKKLVMASATCAKEMQVCDERVVSASMHKSELKEGKEKADRLIDVLSAIAE